MLAERSPLFGRRTGQRRLEPLRPKPVVGHHVRYPRDAPAQQDAEHPAQHADHTGLDEEDRADLALGPSEGLHDPDLGSLLGDEGVNGIDD